jgi:hypothetical protein
VSRTYIVQLFDALYDVSHLAAAHVHLIAHLLGVLYSRFNV